MAWLIALLRWLTAALTDEIRTVAGNLRTLLTEMALSLEDPALAHAFLTDPALRIRFEENLADIEDGIAELIGYRAALIAGLRCSLRVQIGRAHV